MQTITDNLDTQTPPPSYAEPCFHGRSLSYFEPVNEEFVKQIILNSSAKTCNLDVFPTHLLVECLLYYLMPSQ